ncbi:uncharacterized protein SCODWIG_01126 [Saccharomycodes ludwigii]|uniref:AAA+ ATPase domain-containing protein n=1 Tax=Saccharomycodes ludwigii TaxID=36035 RepID=A0A376B3U3_9ASCO|nr:hypothetical protein SCDLUD_002028 [Saccharomycodes ludwigii]KAH3902213.1 hypothetical protein SCDLUD_002028 [Saccharomycodes ludwigii]SSD59365.1 uncharacterized protein SCODWIG_01126 [Saccharomycodes ludwigii]
MQPEIASKRLTIFVDAKVEPNSIKTINECLYDLNKNTGRNIHNKIQYEDILDLLKKAIQNKVQALLTEEKYKNHNYVYFKTSTASIITENKINFIKSLLRVLLSENGINKLDEDKTNLLFSSFIVDLDIQKTFSTNFSTVQNNPPIFKISLYKCNYSFPSSINEENLSEKLKNTVIIDDTENDKFDMDDYSIMSITNKENENESKLNINDTKFLNKSQITLLPDLKIDKVWECLQFPVDFKENIYRTASVFAQISQQNYICNEPPTLNQFIIFHGPAGTGKTTMCKALAQKLSIRMGNLEGNGILIEFPCGKIFSRWFGDSTKNLEKLFSEIEQILEKGSMERTQTITPICLLMDEVETIASSRSSLMAKNETSDSIRVVNTLLTQIDKFKKYPNFLLLATSNFFDSLDPAFVDRADKIIRISLPSNVACKRIIKNEIQKLIKSKIIIKRDSSNFYNINESIIQNIGNNFYERKMSGRAIVKIPILCISQYFDSVPVDYDTFILALSEFYKKEY